MAGLLAILVVGGVIASMAISMYMYTQYQTNFIEVNEGEPVIVGPVEYSIFFDGTHMGDKDTVPEDIFVKIKIVAENISDERTRMSGGQFHFVDEDDQTHSAIYGGFYPTDLIEDWLDPGDEVNWTTQFDIPFDEDNTYHILVRPSKQQSTVDTARVCITNC